MTAEFIGPPRREGPHLTTEYGELDEAYWSCGSCRYLRVYDYHYFYCRDLGDQNKPDLQAHNGDLYRLRSWPKTPRQCRFLTKQV